MQRVEVGLQNCMLVIPCSPPTCLQVSLHTRCAVFATCNPGRNQRCAGLAGLQGGQVCPVDASWCRGKLLVLPAHFHLSGGLNHLRRYNPRVPLASQLNISGPLLSRFDIVILLLDQVRQLWPAGVGCWQSLASDYLWLYKSNRTM